METFAGWRDAHLMQIEAALAAWMSSESHNDLGQVMRYAVLDGGKRLRPLLVLATSQAVQGNPDAAMRAACAVELIHAYSLVHDDLPCMDNDVLRRNKPTVHVQYGQASALLAGDAMQALAFEVLATPNPTIQPATLLRLCYLLSNAAGHAGMAGGQAIDLASIGLPLTLHQLQTMHSLKTGALIEASVLMGATCGNVSDSNHKALQAFGKTLGLAYQVVDDVLDVTSDSITLGKTAGKDAQQNKPTYVSVMGIDSAKELAHSLHTQAIAILQSTHLLDTTALLALTHSVVGRHH